MLKINVKFYYEIKNNFRGKINQLLSANKFRS